MIRVIMTSILLVVQIICLVSTIKNYIEAKNDLKKMKEDYERMQES